MVQAALLWLSLSCLAQANHRRRDEPSDLTNFVTRPDIRVPRWNVTVHNPDRLSRGYWFLAPYARWMSRPKMAEYVPAQIGPVIYDGNGDLVWSGARIDNNHNVQDFRPYKVGNETFMSYMLAPTYEGDRNDTNGTYITMNSKYERTFYFVAPQRLNGHEFQVIEDGTKALTLFTNNTHIDPVGTEQNATNAGTYSDDCPVELDMRTKEVLFQWCPLQNGFSPNETTEQKIPHWAWGWSWDYMHANSVDKFANGDLLFSSRFTWGIHRVSRADSSLVWNLGGKHNNFEKDFEFRYQHNAKIITETHNVTIITLLDNASAEEIRGQESANTSSAMMIALYTTEQPMRAELLHRWYRPDGDLSRKRGNVDILDNGNIWVSWSDFGYHSEQTMDGEVVMEATFSSSRLSTYRAYKAPFVGHPTDAPIVKALQHAAGDDGVMAAYVSWNGATEVARWKFEGCRAGSEEVVHIATLKKAGFETSIEMPGLWSNITATALDAQDEVIGRSLTTATELTIANYAPGKPSGYLSATVEAWAGLPKAARARIVFSIALMTMFVQICIFAAVLALRRTRRFPAWQLPTSRERYEDQVRRLGLRLILLAALCRRSVRRWVRSRSARYVADEKGAAFSPLRQDDGSTDTSDDSGYSLDYSDMQDESKEYDNHLG